VYQRSAISPWPSLVGVLKEVVVTPDEGGVMLAM
jgi:hypothetical protein